MLFGLFFKQPAFPMDFLSIGDSRTYYTQKRLFSTTGRMAEMANLSSSNGAPSWHSSFHCICFSPRSYIACFRFGDNRPSLA